MLLSTFTPSLEVQMMWHTDSQRFYSEWQYKWQGAEVVEEGAKTGQNIMWLLYLCIKPETSEM